MLRVVPNRGIQLYGQKRNLPRNDAILNLSLRIGNISASSLDKTFKLSKNDLQFKASRERLSRGDLLGLVSDRQPLVGNKNDSTQTQSIGTIISKMKDTPLGQATGFSRATTEPASSSSKKTKRTYNKKKQYKFEENQY
jgi:hypothetical protein